MKRIYLPIVLILLFSNSATFAAEVVGQGWGDTEAVAKREALADISSRISVTVRSKVKMSQSVNATLVNKTRTESVSQFSENTVETNSDLPILGAAFRTRKEGEQMAVTAVLETGKNLPLYEQKRDELRARLSALNTRVSTLKATEAQYHAIMEMLTLLDEFKNLSTVALYLGGNPQGHGVDESALQAQLRATSKQVSSLDLAAKLLTAGIDESGVYIYPAKARNSNEITPFASLVKDKLSTQIKTVLNPRDAAYTFVGEYEESADAIDITYHLVDSTALAQKTNTVRLSKQAYAGLETKPKAADFEQLLKAGVAVSGELRVDISTNLGGRDLLFTEGHEVELFVKLSEMGYFYVVGHTVKQSEKNSYLLELSETEGARKFVHFVNADDANKWISIGKFNVAPPFGVEGLQVVASNKDLADSLPSGKKDAASGLYVVSTAPKEGIIKTRALIKKFAKAAQSSEATLLFTTRAR